MSEETQKLLNERQLTHGDYVEVARVAQAFRELMRGTRGWSRMNNAQKEALDSMASKFGRLGSGDPNFRDHWDDISGYSTQASLNCDSDLKTVVKDIENSIKDAVSLKGDTGVVSLPKIVSKGFFASNQPEDQQA